jgi:hypothetical protein
MHAWRKRRIHARLRSRARNFEIDSEGEEETVEEGEMGEGAVLGTTLRTQAGLVPEILDIGEFSIWTTRAEFDKAGGKNFILLSTTARSVDGSPVKVDVRK